MGEAKYPEFGQYLLELTKRNLPPGSVRDKSQAAIFLRDALSVDRSVVYQWFSGAVSGKKPLVVDNLLEIALQYLGKPGLRTQSALEYWLRLGPANYSVLLEKERLIEAIKTRSIQPGIPVLSKQHIERRDCMDALSQKLQWCINKKQHMVLHGPAGVGKTTLVRLWANHPLVDAHFDQIVYWPFDEDSISKLLSQHDRKDKTLIILDDVQNPDKVDAILATIPSQNSVLLITRNSAVAARFSTSGTLTIRETSWEDAIALAHMILGGETELPLEKLKSLCQAVRWNILGLRLMLARVAQLGWDSTLLALKQTPPVKPITGVEKDLFLPVYIAYEALPQELKSAFALLGAIPNFHSYHRNNLAALWMTTVERASNWIDILCRDAGLLGVNPLSNSEFTVHNQAWKFANNLTQENVEFVEKNRNAWLEQMVVQYETSERVLGFHKLSRMEKFSYYRKSLLQKKPKIVDTLNELWLDVAKKPLSTTLDLYNQYPGLHNFIAHMTDEEFAYMPIMVSKYREKIDRSKPWIIGLVATTGLIVICLVLYLHWVFIIPDLLAEVMYTGSLISIVLFGFIYRTLKPEIFYYREQYYKIVEQVLERMKSEK